MIRPEFKEAAVYETLSVEHRNNHELITSLELLDRMDLTTPDLSVSQLVSILKTVDYLYDDDHKLPKVLLPYLCRYMSSRNEWFKENFTNTQWVTKEVLNFYKCLLCDLLNGKRRDDAIDWATRRGRLDWIQFARSSYVTQRYQYSAWTYSYAIQTGNLEILKWILHDGAPVCGDDAEKNDQILCCAAKYGQLGVYKAYCVDSQPLEQDAWTAAEYGHNNILAYLVEQGIDISDSECPTQAAENGHLTTLQWLYGKCDYSLEISAEVVYKALQSGHLHIVQWLVSQGVRLLCAHNRYNALHTALLNGDLEVIKWVHNQIKSQGDEALLQLPYDHLINNGRLNVLKWVFNELPHDFPLNNDGLCTDAARYGKLPILKWLLEIGCAKSSNACLKWAIYYGQIDVVKYLKESGCPDIPHMCVVAAQGDQLRMLKWLHVTHKYPLHKFVVIHAARNGNIEMIDWANENGLGIDRGLMLEAALNGKDGAIRWLRRQGINWHPDTATALVVSRNIEALKWAISKGCPWDKNHCLDIATTNGFQFRKRHWANESMATWITEQR